MSDVQPVIPDVVVTPGPVVPPAAAYQSPVPEQPAPVPVADGPDFTGRQVADPDGGGHRFTAEDGSEWVVDSKTGRVSGRVKAK